MVIFKATFNLIYRSTPQDTETQQRFFNIDTGAGYCCRSCYAVHEHGKADADSFQQYEQQRCNAAGTAVCGG